MLEAHIVRLNTDSVQELFAMVENIEMLEGAEIKSVSEFGTVVAIVDGIEVYVDKRIKQYACDCCGHTSSVEISYNRPQDVNGDPLGIK